MALAGRERVREIIHQARFGTLTYENCMMEAKTLCSTFVVAAILSAAPMELFARTLGMVANNTTNSVTVFDADTYAVLGTVPVPPGGEVVGDVLITPDLKLGFVTNFGYEVSVINLTTSPPTLAGGTNPILISNAGEDLSISPDGKFLLVSDGSAPEPLSVIDIASRSEIHTLSVSQDHNSVDVCSNGAVLVTSFSDNLLRRLTISGTGVLTDTGDVLSVGTPTLGPRNVTSQ
jgi:WD40 repeat protein